MSILAYLFKHSSQIIGLLDQGKTPDGSHLLLDLLNANLPIIKKMWPALNQNGLLDDTVELLKSQLSSAP